MTTHELYNLIRQSDDGATLDGQAITAGGNLHLGSLTTLPEGVSLSAGGNLHLGSLTTPEQRYSGEDVHLDVIDGYTMQRLSTPRGIGECEVWRAAYFNGRGDGQRCYIARSGDYTAHGDSVATAVRDVEFKRLNDTFDESELVEQIRSKGTVTFNEYRLLTGACESGLRHGLASLGLPEDTQELPLDRVIELSAGQYGGDRIAAIFA